MIVWFTLFLIVIVISFLLALMSMRDYAEIPRKSSVEYSLFLIRSPSLNQELLSTFQQKSAEKGLLFSFERLFKGSESALCIFGPKEILGQFNEILDLLELEDYSSDFSNHNTTVWEVNSKAIEDPFADFPKLLSGELFAWQVIMSGKFAQIRAGMRSSEHARRKEFEGKFNKLPRPFSNSQMIDFYKQRSMDRETAKELSLFKLLDLLLFR